MRVAISGSSGCGNTTVSGIVAQRLELKRINYTLRNMAEERGMPFNEFHGLADERFPRLDYELDEKLVGLAAEGDCVVATRLAVWLDDDRVLKKLGVQKKYAFDYKFWLDAPLEVRAARIARREGKPAGLAVEETRARDASNESRYSRAYGIKWGKPDDAALLDTAALDAEGVAEKIVSEIRCRNTRN
jgi:CMP/dCMP kinase